MASLGLGILLRVSDPLGAGVVLSGLIGLVGGPALAQDFAAAGAHATAGQDAFAAGKFELAAKEFQAAFNITRDPTLLVSIGESWQRANDGPKALAAYRSYLSAQPQAADRDEIEARIKGIETALAPPAPTNPPTATGTPGATGTATTEAPKTEAPKTEAPKTEAPKTEAPKTEAAKTDAAPGTPGTTITPPEPPPSRLRTAGWVVMASAVAMATGGAIVGLGAQNRADELRRRTMLLVGGQPPIYDENQREAYTTLMTEGKAYNDASIALLSLAGAAAVVGGSLLIADAVKRPRALARPTEKTADKAPPESAPAPLKAKDKSSDKSGDKPSDKPAAEAAPESPAPKDPAQSPAPKDPAQKDPAPTSSLDLGPRLLLAPVVTPTGAGLVLLGGF